MDAEETRAWLALALSSQGRPAPWLALAEACGGAVEAVRAEDATLAACGASTRAIAILREAWTIRASEVLEDCRRHGLCVAGRGAAAYPRSLLTITDSPLALFWRGGDPAAMQPGLAMVGARRCSEYGLRTASRLAREAAAAGLVVVSGLARGIDAAAHRGAMETGRTMAVLAGGLDHIYPGEHRSLAERICSSGGCLLSEQPPGARPRPRLFPYRNRLITGLALATVVVEAGTRSGSLASARHALDQGREVFAVPGPIDSPSSQGSNELLVQGAAPLCRIEDLAAVNGLSKLLSETKVKKLKKHEISLRELGEDERAVLQAIGLESATCDDIQETTALDGTRVLTLLTALELDGLVRREAHGRFRACPAGG